MDKLRNVFGGEPSGGGDEEERGIMDEINENLTFSWSTRIKGFIICFVVGILLSLLGSALIMLSLVAFAILYTLGNILSMSSTFFLMGPWNQMKRMFAETRFVAALVMLACMVLTLVSAFVFHNTLLCILFCILQFLALTWYSLSYIPFARNAIKSCVSSMLD